MNRDWMLYPVMVLIGFYVGGGIALGFCLLATCLERLLSFDFSTIVMMTVLFAGGFMRAYRMVRKNSAKAYRDREMLTMDATVLLSAVLFAAFVTYWFSRAPLMIVLGLGFVCYSAGFLAFARMSGKTHQLLQF